MAVVKLAGEVKSEIKGVKGELKALVTQVSEWTAGHLTASEMFMAHQREKVGDLFAEIQKCAVSVQKAVDSLVEGGTVMANHEKSLNRAHKKIRSLRNQLYLGFFLIFLFLLTTDHATAMIDAIKKKFGIS